MVSFRSAGAAGEYLAGTVTTFHLNGMVVGRRAETTIDTTSNIQYTLAAKWGEASLSDSVQCDGLIIALIKG